MAILKKGSRRIVVDGHNFLWRVRHKPTYSQGFCWSSLILSIQDADVPGSTLVVALHQPQMSNWLQRLSSPVLPSQVADYVRRAINLGWQPTQHGKPFLLKGD
ncbi:hypothetical protein IAD21_04480 [Abditibacteriota bacterium]|nr:hypothetical protein IAD21_04480 [Abditibacteriota bacterium]